MIARSPAAAAANRRRDLVNSALVALFLLAPDLGVALQITAKGPRFTSPRPGYLGS